MYLLFTVLPFIIYNLIIAVEYKFKFNTILLNTIKHTQCALYVRYKLIPNNL